MPRRLGTGLLIGLLHLVLLAALLHHASRSRPDDSGPVEYMSYIVVPKAAAPAVRKPDPPTALPPLRRSRPVAATTSTAPVSRSIPAPEPAQAQAAPEAPAPAASASPAPKLDMLALRADAGRLGKDYAPDSFEQVRAAESRLEAEKNDLGRAIAKAKRPPCTKKYSGGTSMNLILLIPLAIETVTDKGCKW